MVRVMPNIPCVVGAGASGYAGGAHATAKDMEKVGLILNSFGIGLPVEEKYLDAVTGLSGSGPAYVFLFIESLADGGVQMGLPRDVALKLALQTVYGSARMAFESAKHLGELKDEVTSPGGTTIAGTLRAGAKRISRHRDGSHCECHTAVPRIGKRTIASCRRAASFLFPIFLRVLDPPAGLRLINPAPGEDASDFCHGLQRKIICLGYFKVE